MLTFILCDQIKVSEEHGDTFFIGRRVGQSVTSPERCNVSEYPRIAERTSGDHHAVAVCFIEHTHRIFTAENIAVAYHRYIHRFLYIGDRLPVGFALVILLTSPSVDRYCRYACRFQQLCGLHSRIAAALKPHPDLRSDRLAGRIHHRGYHVAKHVQLFEQRRSLSVFHDFRHRTPDVQIKYAVFLITQLLCCKTQDLRVAPEELESYRTFILRDLKEISAFPVTIPQTLGAHHFRIH